MVSSVTEDSPNGSALVQRFAKLFSISLLSRSVHYPNQLGVKVITRPTLVGLEVRMLELDHPPLICRYIPYMFLSTIGWMDNLLPGFGKLSFPSSVPFGFVFPPRITGATSFMGSAKS